MNIKHIEENTRAQHVNPNWISMRKDRLTASNFGIICKMQNYTLCGSTVKKVLYGRQLNINAVAFGRLHEKTARERYEKRYEKYKVKVINCRLFIDSENPFLGAWQLGKTLSPIELLFSPVRHQ